jgi:DNA polymerase
MDEIYNTIRSCHKCSLCDNQPPLVQKSTSADIFWVGLSAVKVSNKKDIPLSPNTNTGKLIHSIEFFFQNQVFHKTNVVKCVPLNDDKIRYPSNKEMKICFSHLKKEIEYLEPKVVFLLGKQVATFVLKEFNITDYSLNDDFNYHSFKSQNITLIPIHHPSFILVYKRKKIHEYMNAIEKIININN